MRYNRVTTAVALLAALGACTTGEGGPSFNPTPHPTRPGQVVIIAGDPALNRDARDGEFALRSSAYGGGGLAVSSDGTVYYRVYFGREGRVVRLGRDGRVQLNAVDVVAEQMIANGHDLWLLGSGPGIAITKVSFTDWRETRIVDWTTRVASKTLKVVDASGTSFSRHEMDELYRDWSGAKIFLRADGTPVIVSTSGRLFEVRGPEKFQEWTPPGYVKALAGVIGGGGFQPQDTVTDEQGQSILLGRTGILYIPRDRPARHVRFPASMATLPPWSAITVTGQESVLLLGGTTTTQSAPRPTLIRADGRMERLDWGTFKRCPGADGTLAAVASALPGGVVRTSDGTIVMNDRRCGQIYAFKLPEKLEGEPLR
ncbi:hypothetical protein [Actinomadura macra]|uniref:hypothetical protein n=1 Tax=Actinomadura macra TaxID=46164 RepID=UPI0012FBFAB7|nr:hypothetical protein [Actinomadura macra]